MIRSIDNRFFHNIKPAAFSFKSNIQFDNHNNNQYLLSFDLDGTFANGTQDDIDKFLSIKNSCNAKLAYVTGKTKESYDKFVKSLAERGIELPTPEFLVTNNGQFIYENIDGKLVPDEEWSNRQYLTGFIDKSIKTAMNEICKKYNIIETADLFNGSHDNSLIIQHNYAPSNFNVEYLIADSLKNTIEKELSSEYNRRNINARIFFDYLPEAMVKNSRVRDKLPKPIIDKDGGINVLHIAAANKADAVNFIRIKNGIKNDCVIAAGNSENDASLANKDFWFILVGNAEKAFKDHLSNLAGKIKIILAKEPGTKGINEGLSTILNQNSSE